MSESKKSEAAPAGRVSSDVQTIAVEGEGIRLVLELRSPRPIAAKDRREIERSLGGAWNDYVEDVLQRTGLAESVLRIVG